jgi:uncharacterized protein (DUF362 family)
MTSRARVALIRTTPATVLRDYERLMELAEFRRDLDPSTLTLLNLDQRRHFPFPSANTTPWQLEGIARALLSAGYRDLACVQHKTTLINVFKGEDLNGYTPILRAYNLTALHDSELADMRWTCYTPKRALLMLDRLCEGCIRIPEYLIGANIVHLPTLKTDSAVTIGGAMRNALSVLLPGRSDAARKWIHELLVDLLSIQQEILAGGFAVMDGTTAGSGPGPYRLYPEVKNVLLASADQVAIDAVAAKLMGFDPLRDVKYLRLAHERGLGIGDVRAIELVGDAGLANENWRFSAGAGPGFERFQRFLMRIPLAQLLMLGAESYRDYLRWPLKERRVFEGWLRGTQWGRLFARYQRPA